MLTKILMRTVAIVIALTAIVAIVAVWLNSDIVVIGKFMMSVLFSITAVMVIVLTEIVIDSLGLKGEL